MEDGALLVPLARKLKVCNGCFACMHTVYHLCPPHPLRQKRVLVPLEPELQMVRSHHVDARNEPVRTASEPVLFAAEQPLQVLHWFYLFVWFGFYFLLLFYYYLFG